MAMTFERRLQDRESWTVGDRCSAAKVLNLLSTKTVFLTVRECFYGTSRFEDFVDRVGSSAPAVSRALKQLENAGVVRRTPYQEPGSRSRDEYQLTPAGEDLLPVFLALMQWGDAHLQDGKPPLSFLDPQGRRVAVRVTADTDSPAMRSDDLEVRYNGR
jgi:DNA-binding HxlR family transcriptional regulator